MKKNINRKYIDSNVFIQAILREDINSQNILKKIVDNEFEGVTSVLSWDELVFILRKFISSEFAIIEGKKFLMFPNLKFIDAKKEIVKKAQSLIENYNIKPRDAIHSATAISLNIKEIISNDSDFDKVKELKRISP